ncbi:hypothetical protein MHW47_00610 [Streptomyces sp. OfavH-34-F]|uniref:hypothetical protein n=1 Tax=Streptomyces sp. OfavH-34-F TaxID=2917760 RepID=UPI001EF28105|nr:hypothetical protein [Streptomyces sp. OfavH-34-F]MCG7522957.1 hypothetical protein [Streptomyces sp. OfavH-34-F]
MALAPLHAEDRQAVREPNDLVGEVRTAVEYGLNDPVDSVEMISTAEETARAVVTALSSPWSLYTPQDAATAAAGLFVQLEQQAAAVAELGRAVERIAGRGETALPAAAGPGRPPNLADALAALHANLVQKHAVEDHVGGVGVGLGDQRRLGTGEFGAAERGEDLGALAPAQPGQCDLSGLGGGEVEDRVTVAGLSAGQVGPDDVRGDSRGQVAVGGGERVAEPVGEHGVLGAGTRQQADAERGRCQAGAGVGMLRAPARSNRMTAPRASVSRSHPAVPAKTRSHAPVPPRSHDHPWGVR